VSFLFLIWYQSQTGAFVCASLVCDFGFATLQLQLQSVYCLTVFEGLKFEDVPDGRGSGQCAEACRVRNESLSSRRRVQTTDAPQAAAPVSQCARSDGGRSTFKFSDQSSLLCSESRLQRKKESF